MVKKGMILAGFGGALILLLLALVLDYGLGREVVLIAPHDEETVKLNRALYVAGDPVADIYGNPMSRPVRVVFPDRSSLVRPEEDPSLQLLAMDRDRGGDPLQVQTVWFFAKFAIPAFFALGVLGLIPWPGRRGT